MCTGKARKGGAVNEYMLHEMARIRVDELREEASRARAGRETRGSRGRRHYLGILGVSGARRAECGSFSCGTVEEACCA
jgi:hypothetical protein